MKSIGNLFRGLYRLAANLLGFCCFLVFTGVVLVGVLVAYPPAQDFLQDAVHQGKKLKEALPSKIGDRSA